MRFPRYLFAALVAFLVAPIIAPLVAASATPSPAPLGTLPPLRTIERVVAHPLCYALKQNIGPAIGKILNNDGLIAKSAPLLSDFNNALGQNGSNSGRKNIILLRMSNLVGPMVNNIAQIQKKLDDPEVFPKQATNSESALLLETRAKLRRILAWQNAQLDIVNGFVQTQALHQMQHEGMGYVSAFNNPDMKSTSHATPAPNIAYQDKDLQAGISNANSPIIDYSMIPGLRLGYNPLSRLIEGVHYVQHATTVDEQHASANIMLATRICSGASHLVPVTPQP